jgi:hypothetical protein
MEIRTVLWGQVLKMEYGTDDKWATTVSTFFEYIWGGHYYGGDGIMMEHLEMTIYVPTSAEIAT